MPALAKRIEIDDEDRAELERIVRSSTAEVRMVGSWQDIGLGGSLGLDSRLLVQGDDEHVLWRIYLKDHRSRPGAPRTPTRGTQEVTDWLTNHPRWSFQFTPTHASWLNQIEIFFSILYRQLLKHGMFFSEEDLAEQMLAFIETYNQTAKPFKWTYTGKILEA